VEIFWTVLASVAVFVVGQAVVKFLIEPWHEYRMLVGRIAHALILHAHVHSNLDLISPVPVEEARCELRSLAGELWQRTNAIPFYGPIPRACRWVPSWPEIEKAASGLIGLSFGLDSFHLKQDYIS
jgi:hypothetical protein